jgi:hypothetical protein
MDYKAEFGHIAINSVFRAYRYSIGHPAFKGLDLTPKGTITERTAQGLDARP